MIKSIQLKLLKIKYSGDSIGDDISVDIKALGRSLRVDKKIKVGTTAEINQEIGRFETDQAFFQVEISVAVIERDLIFNDVGAISSSIKVDTAAIRPQQFIFEVSVSERRSMLGKFSGNKTADFEIILEANVIDAVQYIQNEDGAHGWLKVKLTNNQSIESLPAFLKVKPESISRGREYFTILEGAHRNKLVSVKLQDDDFSNLISGVRHGSAARAIYSISRKIFILNGKKYATTDYKNAPWKKGLYDIEIPDYPHPGGAKYEKEAPRAKTWFRIGHTGERYLHTGGYSLGCITVTETTRWSEIYNVLIRARKGDSMSVGVLEVVD